VIISLPFRWRRRPPIVVVTETLRFRLLDTKPFVDSSGPREVRAVELRQPSADALLISVHALFGTLLVVLDMRRVALVDGRGRSARSRREER